MCYDQADEGEETQLLTPIVSFFDFSFKSPKRSSPIKVDGDIREWDKRYLVPDLMRINRYPQKFADVYFTWDDDALYIGVRATGRFTEPEVNTTKFWLRDSLELWLDLRNDKTQQTYSKHCHHFFFLPKGRKSNPKLATAGEYKQPGSAIEDTIYDYSDIEVACTFDRLTYSMEARIPKSVIPTYDPKNYPALGFNYFINDSYGRIQFWSCNKEVPTYRDPSTWGTVELVG